MRRPLVASATALVLAGSVLVTAAPAQAATTTISTSVSQETFHTGEGIYVTGGVKVGGKARAGVAVTLVRVDRSGKKSSVVTAKTSSTGRYALPLSPTESAHYYVRSTGSTAAQGRTVTIRWTRDGGRLEERAAQIASRLGAAKGAVRTLSRAATRKADASATRIRYRDYAKGMLVEVYRGGVTRTWFVPAKIRNRYLTTGGPTGAFGVPRRDPRCVVLETGCVQRFSRVTAYQSATTRSAAYQAGTSRRSEYVAVARSQVGYDEPAWRRSKYNTWAGSNNAWCGIFASWVAAASGHPSLVEKRTTFTGMIPYVKAEMRTYTPRSTKYSPRPGTLVFFDNYNRTPKTPSHAGIFLSRSGNTVRVIEGNSSPTSTFTRDRGVYIHTRYVSSVVFYADPDW